MREAHAALFISEEILLVTTTHHESPGGGVRMVQHSKESNPFCKGDAAKYKTNLVKTKSR